MRRIRLVNLACVLVALAFSCAACSAESRTTPSAAPHAAPKTAAKIVVYYFHGTSRCYTCRTIEAYAEEAVKAAFASELKSGAIEWKPTNVDQPGNRHFIDDFQLYTRSLVVVDGSNSKRFKNLDRVWRLVRDKPAFVKYVQDEVRSFQKS